MIFEERNQMAEMETEHQSQLVELEQQHQAKDEEIEKMKELCEKNQELMQENDLYKQKLALLHAASGRKMYNTSGVLPVDSPDSPFEFVPPKPKNLRRTTAKSTTVILEDLFSESEESEEDSSDKNWVPVQNDKPPKKAPSGDDANMEDQSQESENSLKIDYPGDITAGSTFFTPPCITPTKKVLREISDIGQALPMKLQRKPSIVPGAPLTADSQENQISILKKKKKALCNSNSSFFSGCSPITEDE
ncbi:hypothetical protein GDO78_021550 [Eleutherodactylus coqui]|uniref:Uncharacterized protein n=1 Tax=Eleutherodactylus coqui TaxID=57060 RepID=A0A8J6B8Z6_ELECQ|nr:hypothetical protein GDO78_021550 [Eleutherodactylus coqui]